MRTACVAARRRPLRSATGTGAFSWAASQASSIDLVVHRPRGAQRGLGRGDRRLRRRALRERAGRPLPVLVRGELGELVHRPARVAQRGRADREREVPERREAVQRPVDDRSVEQRGHAGGGHEQLVGDGIVTPRAAQAEGVPRVEDLQLFLRDGDHARRGAAVDDAAREEDGRVGDPAAVGPPARDDEAAVDRPAPCRAGPRPRPGSRADRRTARRGCPPAGTRRAGRSWPQSTGTSRRRRPRVRAPPHNAARRRAAARGRRPRAGYRPASIRTRAAGTGAHREGAAGAPSRAPGRRPARRSLAPRRESRSPPAPYGSFT